jgi:hypothetical protein
VRIGVNLHRLTENCGRGSPSGPASKKPTHRQAKNKSAARTSPPTPLSLQPEGSPYKVAKTDLVSEALVLIARSFPPASAPPAGYVLTRGLRHVHSHYFVILL